MLSVKVIDICKQFVEHLENTLIIWCLTKTFLRVYMDSEGPVRLAQAQSNLVFAVCLNMYYYLIIENCRINKQKENAMLKLDGGAD